MTPLTSPCETLGMLIDAKELAKLFHIAASSTALVSRDAGLLCTYVLPLTGIQAATRPVGHAVERMQDICVAGMR